MSQDPQALAGRLGHTFRDEELLLRALTHRSKSGSNYERLEFLGDSVLSLVISAALFERFPQLSEGELTRLRARLVRRETLAQLARGLEIGEHLQLGSGELKSGGFDRDSILADALEAMFGAIYRDAGIEAAQHAVLNLYRPQLDQLDPATVLKDPKTRLQEYLQQHGLPTPVYEVLEIRGEAHQQHFVVTCRVTGIGEPVRGEGGSRRYAEQDAAAQACELLGCEEP